MTQKSTKIPVNQAEKHSLAISDLRIRLEFLERENQKLLGKIEKKQTELRNSIDLIGKIALEVAQRSAPVLQQLLELDLKLHAVFADIFTGRKLGKQTRKKIETIYANLQASGLISPARLQADRQRSSELRQQIVTHMNRIGHGQIDNLHQCLRMIYLDSIEMN
jgi:uncharacterized coiled-coil DUF342 family protein